jgi:branched-chain amino acid transport system substrate-binding protein
MSMKKALLLAAVLGWVPAATHAQAPADVVKIGVIGDQSSAFAHLAGTGSIIAAQMAVEDFGGKVLGKPIVVISADHQNKPDIAAAISRRWIDVEGVNAFASIETSGPALAIQQIGKQTEKAVMLISSAGSDSLVNENCSPVGVLWAWNIQSMVRATATNIVKSGRKKWFFITMDYVGGHDIEKRAGEAVTRAGGEVVGSVRHPLNTSDFASYLLQAQASNADVIALASAGGDTINAIKQANEFGLTKDKLIAPMLLFITDVHGLGLPATQGMWETTAFYWDRTDESRAWSKRFFERHKAMPTLIQAGVYSSVTHYLKAVQAANSVDAKTVVAKMRELPVNDIFATNGKLREDGLMLHDLYVLQVKSPAESKGPWDYYKVVSTVPAAEAYWPLSESRCPLIKH